MKAGGRSRRGRSRRAKALGLQPKLKVLVAFYQVVTVIDSTYSTKMPPLFMDFVKGFRFVGFKWEDILAPDGCMASGLIGKLVVTAVAPLVFIAAVLAHMGS